MHMQRHCIHFVIYALISLLSGETFRRSTIKKTACRRVYYHLCCRAWLYLNLRYWIRPTKIFEPTQSPSGKCRHWVYTMETRPTIICTMQKMARMWLELMSSISAGVAIIAVRDSTNRENKKLSPLQDSNIYRTSFEDPLQKKKKKKKKRLDNYQH
jgi:hypothetical protein